VTVMSTDKGNATISHTFVILIVDQNDAPTGVRVTIGGSVSENATANTAFALLEAIDADAVDRHTFQVLSPTAHFAVSGSLLVYLRTDPAYVERTTPSPALLLHRDRHCYPLLDSPGLHGLIGLAALPHRLGFWTTRRPTSQRS
jgi:hypothetical protein